MKRPVTDEKLCFVCQEKQPIYKAERLGENFVLCGDCLILVENENKAHNRIKAAIHLNDARGIFSYTLGMNLIPIKVKHEEL